MNENELIAPQSSAMASVIASAFDAEQLSAQGRYTATCYDADGNEKWADTFSNLVTTLGKNDLLDKYLTGSAYTAAFFMGLISSLTYTAIVAADTSAQRLFLLQPVTRRDCCVLSERRSRPDRICSQRFYARSDY